MKRPVFVLILVLVLSVAQAAPPTASFLSSTDAIPFPDPEATISLDLQDVRLKDILKMFSVQSGMNFIASEAVQDRTMTLYMDKVPIREAMDKIFLANNLYYELDKESNIFIVKDWGKPEITTLTKVYQLKYQSVSNSALLREKGGSGSAGGGGLTASIRELLSSNGKMTEDAYSNSLVITDIPSRFSVIEQLIVLLDVPQPQVMLEVEILDVNKSKIDKMGVNWPETLANLTISGTRMTRFPFGDAGTGGTGRTIEGWDFDAWNAKRFGPSMMTFIGSTLTLDFLRSQSDTKTLARPKILTLNNETAEIKITTQESTNQSQSSNADTATSTTGVERSETGVSLRVTPQVNTNGEITMYIVPKVADTKNGLTITTESGTITVKDPEERSSRSVVRMKDGETIIIGGLIRSDYSITETRMPFFGDIPILGALFRHKNKDRDRERELLIFITPRIIKDGQVQIARTSKPVLPVREQSTVSGFDRRSLVQSSLDSFDKR